VFRPSGHESIWLFVTEDKDPDRTQYHDELKGDTLYWDGQTSGRTDDWIISHAAEGLEILVFYRKSKRQFSNYGFVYEGPFNYVSHSGGNPAHFVLQRASLEADVPAWASADIEGYEDEETYWEGRSRARLTNYYERNPRLRATAVRIHGTACKACGFDFEATYGERGRHYIEVHHLRPVSDLGEATAVDPATDMTVVCANCHRMIHRRRGDVLSLAALRALLRD
jgi:5-methylcytosine-specific restriction enzyme A